MKISGSNLIAGKESRELKDVFYAFNPQTMESLPEEFHSASENEVDRALKNAAVAFSSFKLTSGHRKAELLRKIADEILLLDDLLIKRAMAETGLPEARIVGERGRTIGQLRMFADLVDEGSWLEATIDTALPDRDPVPKPDLRRMLIPLGPVVVFTASNFPLAFSTAGGDTASALAAGNPVIVKGHESHPGTNELVARAITKAIAQCALPAGVFSTLNGNGPKVGQSLVKHPLTKAVGFTGSFRAGKALFDTAALRPEPIPVFAEMGSINPLFIFPEKLKSNGTAIAQTVAGSVTLGAGQFCTNPGLLVAVQDENLDHFSRQLGEAIKQTQAAVMLNKGIHNHYEKNKQELLKQQDVKLVAERDADTVSKITGRPAVAKVPAAAFIKNPILHEEIFGPFTMLVICSDFNEMQQVADILKGQLTVTVHATENEMHSQQEIVNTLREKAGRVLFGGVPTGVEVCPAMQHGGPFPATTDARFTSVGTAAIKRFVRPVAFQNWPDDMLPGELQNNNPLDIWRTVNGSLTKEAIT